MSPLLLHVFSTFAPAGPQVRTAQLVNAIGPAFRHAVVAMDGVTDARELVSPEVDLQVLQAPPRAGSLRTSLRMRTRILEQEPDLVLTYNWGAIDVLIAKKTGLEMPILHHEDGFLPDEAQRRKARRGFARRALLKGAAGLVVPSERLATIARDEWKQPASKVHLIPNGIPLERFEASADGDALRLSLGIPSNAVVIGACGHLRPEKNPVRLIDALALMREQAHLVFIGDGPERRAVEEARAGGLRDRVHLVGHVDDPAPYYQLMDVFALSSDTEQMPVALLEAMASSLPVVSTDVGDVRRVLPDEQDNFVIPLSGAATPISLAAALDALAAGPALREQLGKTNRARVRDHYSFDAMRAAHEALWTRLAGRG